MNRRQKLIGLFCRLAGASVAAVIAASIALKFGVGSPLDAQGQGNCAPPIGNQVTCENQLAGNPASEWDVEGAGDTTIQGFTTDISVNRGQTVSFKIKSTASNYHLDIYRMGFYGGMGARKIATVNPSVSLPQSQPNCLSDPTTGLIDCGNWAVSATWAVPSTAVSGIYFAKAVRTDSGGASHIVFVVRDDSSTADLLFQTSDTTWQAYNQYGGNSLYVGGPGVNPGRAYKVSYNRPFTTRETSPEDWVFNAEYPMVRWLESNGFNVSYATGVDSDRSGAKILQHKAFVSVGHDEYWSGAQRTNVEAARAAGIHLAFFSGNEVFWKTRWESSLSTPATTYRTLTSYKETHANAKIDPAGTSVWTGTWQDPRFSPPGDGGRPQNALTGTLFSVNCCSTAITVPAADGKLRFWRGTTVAQQAVGGVALLPDGTLGYEWDSDADNGFRPAGLFRLSDTDSFQPAVLVDQGSTYDAATAKHALTLYRHSSGALVFGAGTVQWSWGLDSDHDRGNEDPSLAMQQATVNLFADMGVQPLTPSGGVVTASPSTDTVPPTSVISSPANGSSVPANSTVTVGGTAADAGGVVAGVEVSTDGGATWHPATGRANWSYSWQTPTAATVTLLSRAVDDSGNLGPVSAGVAVSVGAGAPTCPCSLWLPSQTPGGGPETDSAQVEVGTRFRSDASGFITAIRFYKFSQNNGTHIGHLWTTNGSLLASVTFSGESAAGWQEATLSSPLAIAANTTYVVSYNTTSGFYAGDPGYFATTGVDNGPLHAPRDGQFGANGVYKYGSSIFPDQTFGSENYWVDIVFANSLAPDTHPPNVIATTPDNGTTGVTPFTTLTAIFNENVTNVTATTVVITNGASAVPAVVTYATGARTATITPSSPLAASTTYTVRIIGGSNGVKDVAGNPLAADYLWSFTTAAPPPPPPNDGPGGPILVIGTNLDPFSRYYAEILRAEGLNAFASTDISLVSPATLSGYDVVVLGAIALTPAQVTMFSDWVNAGGNLVAMRPDKKLASLLGLADAAATVSEGYVLVNTSAAPGAGIVGQTMQFHGTADRYTLSGATSVATLYSDANTATPNPAVTVRTVGALGGHASAFAFDLARSIVYTRQGNPAWAGQERDGTAPIRSDDLFFGAAGQPDWVNLNKVAIPHADEQQRLFANLLLHINSNRKPLPRFWYFPRGEKAAIVMTGDDHGLNGTAGRFDIFKANSPANCNVNNWECVRGTSYIYPDTPLTNTEAAAYDAQGFEIAVHVTTNCGDYTPASLEGNYSHDLNLFYSLFPSLPPVVSNRTHCIVWSDYDTQPQVALSHGIRLDTNYYYWPEGFVQNRPGFMTGSGMPMRFTKVDGTMIDVYQAASQLTDESGQVFPMTVDALLDGAVGPSGYYGFFTANMHTDAAVHAGSAAVVASALARSVPVISARQALTWLDGRNSSSFGSISWNGTSLAFTVAVGAGANGIEGMLPLTFGTRSLSALTRSGSPATWRTETLKGVTYAIFSATAGSYSATYQTDTTAPTITSLSVTPANLSAIVNWTTNEAADSVVDFGTAPGALTRSATVAGLSASHSVALTNLASGTIYYYRVRSGDSFGNTATSPLPPAAPATFTTTTPPAFNCPCTLWPNTQVPGAPTQPDNTAIEVGLKFKASYDGFITGIRFYKDAQNTGTHTGHLWTSSGALLATVTFAGESASGWQTATFSQPVAVSANTTYLASYFAPNGFYSADGGYFANQRVSGPLTGLSAAASGGNGVFRYGSTGVPTETFNSTNYWVDVVFATSVVFDTTPPVISAISATADAAQTTITWTTNEAASSRIDYGTNPNLLNQTAVDSALTTSHSSTLNTLSGNTTYYFRVTSLDQAGNAATSPVPSTAPLTFTTLALPTFGCPCSIWPASHVPAVASVSDPDAVELGLKFRTSQSGFISAIRFYKGALNTGLHTGSLWTLNGTRLATVTFGTESATGWQQAALTPPVAVDANTTYVVSYHTNAGGYSADPAVLQTSGVTGGPLLALAEGVDGSNGVFGYGSGGFPTQSFNSTSYAVDVVFVATLPTQPFAVRDTLASDFSVGSATGGVAVAQLGDGELKLSATLSEAFAGPGLPANWTSTEWNAGGAATVGAGTVNVDGTLLGLNTVLQANQSLAFKATFASDAFQHAGLALTFNESLWAMFSTGSGGSLKASTNNGVASIDTPLPGNWLGAPHMFAINWTATAVVFSIDGAVVATHTTTINAALRPVFSDFTVGGGGLQVDWLQLGPYGSGGTFTSRVLDAGAAMNWTSATTVATVPVNTTVALTARFGNTPVPDGTWSGFTALAKPTATLATTSRYVQYQATFVGTADDTPILESIAFVGEAAALPSITVADTSVDEGSSGNTFAAFNLSLSAPRTNQVSVSYSVVPGTATAADFTASSGIVTFAPGTTSASILVAVVADTLFEPSETFILNLSNPVNATLARNQAIATILDDDVPTLSIGNVTVTEGNAGTMNAALTVSLSAATTKIVTVSYATANGTAVAPGDYTTTSGILTIPAGATTGQIVVPVIGDALDEANETLTVVLSAPANASIATGTGTVTITDDDPAPSLSINDISVTEGNSGTSAGVFTVTLSAPSGQTVAVNYATASGTASAPGDFTSTNGTLTFTPGVTSATISVPIVGDTSVEVDQAFVVNLTSPVNATISDSQGTGTILDNDVPTVSISNTSVTEGNSGTVNAVFNVSLSGATSKTVNVNYATSNGTAVAPGDYTTRTGTATIAAGATTTQITVPVVGDTLDEANETFTVTLSAPVNASLGTATATGTINDDDPSPSLSINNATVTETDSGSVTATFTVTLSAISGQNVTVNYQTANGTASSPSDYTATSGTLSFPPGTTSRTIAVSVNGDTLDEPSETFAVNLSGASGASIADSQGVGTITDNDPPALSVNNVSVTEGNTGSVNLTFTVSLSSATSQVVFVSYATANGTATAPGDYSSRSGLLTFLPNVTTQTVVVPINGDTLDEDDETFTLNLSGATNATIADAQGVGTIQDNDASVSISVGNVTVTEGNTGSLGAAFAVTLSAVSGRTVTVNYSTANGTATSPADYTATSGQLTFAPGTTSQNVTVQVIGDLLDEDNETFTLGLNNASNATIADASGLGTINDNDATPVVTTANVATTEGNTGTKTLTFTFTLSAASGRTVTLNYVTANGTATANTDYASRTGTITFSPGSVTQTVAITINGDRTVEGNETFFLNLSTPVNVTLGATQVTGTIQNDD